MLQPDQQPQQLLRQQQQQLQLHPFSFPEWLNIAEVYDEFGQDFGALLTPRLAYW